MLKLFRPRADESPSAARAGDLTLHRPWARISSETPGLVGGFVTIINAGGERDRLLSASSPAAAKVEIHAIRVVGPDIRMRPLADGLAIPAGTTIELKPRGYHLLLADLGQTLEVGAMVAVSLVFERVGRVDLELAVADRGLVGIDILNEENHRG